MSILVTGGVGFIGSHVVRQLTESGEKLVVLDNLSSGFKEALINGETLVIGNCEDEDLVQKLIQDHKVKTVMHFAASIEVSESVRDPLTYFTNNTSNTVSLLKACVRQKVSQFIFSSTAAVYEMPPNGVASENSETKPLSPYGFSKLMSEQIIEATNKAHDMRYVILRYFNAAGADPQARMGQRTKFATHLIKVCCQAALGKIPEVSIYGDDYKTPDGTAVRDYVHVEDLASAHLGALKYLEQTRNGPLTVNVGYGQEHSVLEVIRTAKRVTGVGFKTRIVGRRPGDSEKLTANSALIREKLYWKPQFGTLEKIIEDAFRWEKKQFS